MSKSLQWTAGAAVLMVLILVAGFLLLIQPQRSEAADLKEQTIAQEDAKRALDAKLTQLLADQKNLPAQQAKLAKLQTQIPATPELPTVVRSLTKVGDDTGVTIVSVTPSAPVALVEAPASAGAPAGSVKAPSADGTTSATTQAAPLVLQQLPMAIVVDGTYASVTNFLNQLEGLDRPILLTSVTVNKEGIDEAETPGYVRLTVSGSMFMAGPVASQDATTTLTPQAAASGAAATAN